MPFCPKATNLMHNLHHCRKLMQRDAKKVIALKFTNYYLLCIMYNVKCNNIYYLVRLLDKYVYFVLIICYTSYK